MRLYSNISINILLRCLVPDKINQICTFGAETNTHTMSTKKHASLGFSTIRDCVVKKNNAKAGSHILFGLFLSIIITNSMLWFDPHSQQELL